MSQDSQLQDVFSWDATTCRERYHDVLPQLIQSLDQTEDIQKQLDYLKLVLINFVPCLPVNQVESLCLQAASLKTEQLFDSLLEKVALLLESSGHQASDTRDGLTAVLEGCLEICDMLETCLGHLSSLETQLQLCNILSFPKCVVHVIQASYGHCKGSAQLYGELIGSLSEQLTALFRKAHSLQMALISLMDKVQVESNCTEEESLCLSQVLHGLFEISKVASSLDVKITVTMWKTISRKICQYKSLVCDRLELDTMLSHLATDMVSSFNYLMQQVPRSDAQSQGPPASENKGFTRGVKILGFQMKVLVTLVRELVENLDLCVRDIYSLICVLQRHTPPCLESTEYNSSYIEEVTRHVVTGVHPLVAGLVTHHRFISILTSSSTEKNNDIPAFVQSSLLLTVLAVLPTCTDDVQERWISPKLYPEDEPRLPVLQALFLRLQHCYIEFSLPVQLPGVMCKGKPQRNISFHEYVCTHLSAFVGCLKKTQFKELETTLLEHVLGAFTHTALLAVDVWSFVGRYGTADLCREHCHFVAQLLKQGGLNPSVQCCHLVILFRRLFKFLAPEHQEEFLKTFPPESELELYSVVPVSAMVPSTAQKLIEALFTKCTRVIHNWLNNSKPSGADLQCLVSSLDCLHNILKDNNSLNRHLSTQQQQLLTDKCCLLVDYFSTTPEGGQTGGLVMETVLPALLFLSGMVVQHLNNKQVLKVLEVGMSSMSSMKAARPVYLKLALCSFLRALALKTLPPSNEQSQCLQIVSKVFSSLMTDDNPLVHQRALEVFCSFAEETPHETVVPEILQQIPDFQDTVVNFLNKVAGPAPETGDMISQLTNEKRSWESYMDKSLEELYPPAPELNSESDPDQPKAKRLRLDEMSSIKENQQVLQQCKKCLSTITASLEELEQVQSKIGLPTAVISELSRIEDRLKNMTNNNT